MLRKTVNSWNDEQQDEEVEQQEISLQDQPQVEGSKRVFVRDAHLFMIGK